MNNVASRFALIVFIAVGLIASNSHAALPFFGKGEVPSLAPMLEDATPAVVSIAVEGTTQTSQQQVPEMFRYFFGMPNEQQRERPFRSLGSGVIINASEGYIVTNHHVVDNADKIIVQLTDGRELEAKKLGADEQSDVALLKVETEGLTELPLADSDKIRVGDFVVAIGNPFGLSQTVTSGIVSALGRSGLNIGGYEDFIQTDAAINRGNSGGALVNLSGQLVGINTAIFGPNGGNVGIGFAIPSNMMKSLVDQIIEFGEVRRGLLGIIGRDLDSGLAEAMNSPVKKGAFVNEVTENSAAKSANIQSGDIIVAINGVEISSFSELRGKIGSMGAGTEVNLTIYRNDEKMSVNVVLGAAEDLVAEARDMHPALEGASFANYEDNRSRKSVRITEVIERSPAAQSGLREGDLIIGVNRQRIESVTELADRIEETEGVIALNLRRGSNDLFIVIR